MKQFISQRDQIHYPVTKWPEKNQTAIIDEDRCIGCTKCIQVCPFDAIVGAAKQLHTVLKTECTGCGLCVDPCPVDCIVMQDIPAPLFDRERAKQRRRARRLRLQRHRVNDQHMELTKQAFAAFPVSLEATQANIAQAVIRAKQKRTSKR